MTVQPSRETDANLSPIASALPGFTWKVYFVERGRMHLVPPMDLMEHSFNTCPCEPVSVETEDDELSESFPVTLIHNAWDGRDFVEQCETPDETEKRREAWTEQLVEQGVDPDYVDMVEDEDDVEFYRALTLLGDIKTPADLLGEEDQEPAPLGRNWAWTWDMAKTIASSPTTIKSKASDLFDLVKLYITDGDRNKF